MPEDDTTDVQDAPELEPAEWVYLALGDAAPVRFPNDPGVIAHHEARGFKQVEAPADRPFVQQPNDAPADEPWVVLVHPLIPGGTNRVPNDPAALQGAYDSGWQLPDEPGDEDQPEDKPAKRASKKAAAPASEHKES